MKKELLQYASQLETLVSSLDKAELQIAAAHIATALDLVKRRLNAESSEQETEHQIEI